MSVSCHRRRRRRRRRCHCRRRHSWRHTEHNDGFAQRGVNFHSQAFFVTRRFPSCYHPSVNESLHLKKPLFVDTWAVKDRLWCKGLLAWALFGVQRTLKPTILCTEKFSPNFRLNFSPIFCLSKNLLSAVQCCTSTKDQTDRFGHNLCVMRLLNKSL